MDFTKIRQAIKSLKKLKVNFSTTKLKFTNLLLTNMNNGGRGHVLEQGVDQRIPVFVQLMLGYLQLEFLQVGCVCTGTTNKGIR